MEWIYPESYTISQAFEIINDQNTTQDDLKDYLAGSEIILRYMTNLMTVEEFLEECNDYMQTYAVLEALEYFEPYNDRMAVAWESFMAEVKYYKTGGFNLL